MVVIDIKLPWFRNMVSTLIMLIVVPGASLLAEEETIGLNEILEGVEAQQMRIEEEIEDAIFSAESLYRERKGDGELKKEVITRRRIYVKRDNKRHEEYLSMIVNGRELKGKEREKELKDWRKNADRQQETKMPLTPEAEGAYDYRLIGSGTWDGVDVWIIGFEARQKDDGYVNGQGYISKDNFNIVRAEFAPAKMPRVIKDMNMSLTYSQVQGYWMPVKFEMDMKIKVSFIVDMFYRHIKIEDEYSQYKFNNKLDDSIFESDTTEM